MQKYKAKPVIFEAITFDEFVEYGRNHGANIENGMPWSFEFNGNRVTHENDKCYLITSSYSGRTYKFTTDDVLKIGSKGEIYPCNIDEFKKDFEPVN